MSRNSLFDALRSAREVFEQDAVAELFLQVSETRVRELAANLEAYLGTNLPKTIERRSELADYRTNPYVLMTCGSAMRLDDPRDFATFLVNNKLYMGLETSFGKSIESILLGAYPIGSDPSFAWGDPPEKLAEFDSYRGLSREERARARANSIWREVDRACVIGSRRYLTTIKSGPNTINDTQVNAMKDAIRDHSAEWLRASKANYGVESIDVVLGLTYGTPRTTNNKDNQLIVKLLESGFVADPQSEFPGALVDAATGAVRVYRLVGSDFWSWIASPSDSSKAPFAFLEILLALVLALREVSSQREVEERLNDRLGMLASAIASLRFPEQSLPQWMRSDLEDSELFWLASAMTSFFDEGI